MIGSEVITLVAVNEPKKDCKGEWRKIDPKKNPFMAMFGIKSVCKYELAGYQTTNIIYGGNSGSPVVNFYGNVVGVVFAGSPSVITNGYMVPYPIIKEFIENN